MTLRQEVLADYSKNGLNVYDLALTADISHGAFRLWHLILKFRDKNNGVAWGCPDVQTLCLILKCTAESFGRWRQELEEALLLKVENIYGPTRKRWRYTILDGTGENSAWASLYSVRVAPPRVGKSRASVADKLNRPTVGQCPPPQSADADRDSGQKPTPSNPLTREEGGAAPALPDVRAGERRPDTKVNDPALTGDSEAVRKPGADMYRAMKQAVGQ
jgi:Helix-turn-helix domain